MRVLTTIACMLLLIFTANCSGGEKSAREALTSSNPSGASPEKQPETASQRLQTLREHCWRPEGPLPGWYVSFDRKGPRADIESLPGGKALEVAASSYAALTGDFDVSVDEVISASFWPYQTFGEEFDYKAKLYAFSSQVAVAEGPKFNPNWLHPIGSSRWMIERKHDILYAFYRDCYYEERNGWSFSELIDARIENFWYNSIEDRPMNSGDMEGDIRLIPISFYRMPGEDLPSEGDFQVLQLNYPLDRRPGNSQTRFNQESSTTRAVSDVDCCLFKKNSVTHEDYAEYEERICCPCTEELEWCCTFSWAVDGWSVKTWWSFVDCIDCAEEAGLGFCFIAHGRRAPDTLYGSWGTIEDFTKECDPPMECFVTQEYNDCVDRIDSFGLNLWNFGAASAPGPKCLQCGGHGGSSIAGGCCDPSPALSS